MFFLIVSILFCLIIPQHVFGEFTIVENGQPVCSIVESDLFSLQERYALEEINHFIEKFTGSTLDILSDYQELPAGNLIVIGFTGSNRYIADLENRRLMRINPPLSEEEYVIKSINDNGRKIMLILGGDESGLIYGIYDFIEKIIQSITGFNLVDIDFHVPRVKNLVIEDLDVRLSPFYPVRCALSSEDPVWMSRHRLNISGAEGVWSGTGIDDGLGTAFKYVYDSQFDTMQDESLDARWGRILDLRRRIKELGVRGVESYLFMYVMGEPTKAIMRNHPELLEERVYYPHSRNGSYYTPLSWTKPEAREVMKELVRSIVKTYSQWLTGFHLRAWGGETRAPDGNNEELQDLLWDIYMDIIETAREVKPEFKIIISGYDQSWLKDPDGRHARKLPKGTVLMQKWGIDGEPTNNPAVDVDFINDIGDMGHYIMVLSHDVEEVMPLWMLESDLFVEGVRRYSNNPVVNGLGGFTLQGMEGLAHLDKIISARMNWNPNVNYQLLTRNYLTSYYGKRAARYIKESLTINTEVLAEYFSDYAGTLLITGQYGNGSRGYATRFWNIIGTSSVKDIITMPNFNTVEYAKRRLSYLLPKQQESANEMTLADKFDSPTTYQSRLDYSDAVHIMKIWVRFFESRMRLLEARELGLRNGDINQIAQKITSAIEYIKEVQSEIGGINNFTNVFTHDNDSSRQSLLDLLDEEIAYLKSLDPEDILINSGTEKAGKADSEKIEFKITEVFNHPNPARDSASFCYKLTSEADGVEITIYTITGRKIRYIQSASAKMGYNEEDWKTRDDSGNKLSNGTYIYKIEAKRGDERVTKTEKLSVMR
ncbi:hypothetical protein GF312_09745 [Candidatus Poribacteria bacterium]|nr:hypothetical protein [Candidatus Poribacteria bacterium]